MIQHSTLKKLFAAFAFFATAAICAASDAASVYPPPPEAYAPQSGLWETLVSRVKAEPFNLYATAIFALAVIHTLCHGFFTKLSRELRQKHDKNLSEASSETPSTVYLPAEICHLLGEVEVIFALWLIPLFAGFFAVFGWSGLGDYIDNLAFVQRKYTEPLFVVVIMCMAATRPIIQLASDIISMFAKLGRESAKAWWLSILLIGPLLGSFITEPAAITICAVLLSEKFFPHKPSKKFSYATLGLLFAAISAGGTLTHFAAPPVLMVAGVWEWDTPFMFANFGWKAILAIGVSVFAIYAVFKGELANMKPPDCHNTQSEGRVPAWIVSVHVLFLAFTVFSLHHPALFVFAFLLFMAFVEATRDKQYPFKIKTPFLVGVFLAALVTHGSLQGWWIEPALKSFSGLGAFVGAIGLSAFNDNAAITYLCTLVPEFDNSMKYMVVAGAVAGGGLTVIANAPNPAGMAILKKYFGKNVSPIKLFIGALFPTIVISAFFFFLP